MCTCLKPPGSALGVAVRDRAGVWVLGCVASASSLATVKSFIHPEAEDSWHFWLFSWLLLCFDLSCVGRMLFSVTSEKSFCLSLDVVPWMYSFEPYVVVFFFCLFACFCFCYNKGRLEEEGGWRTNVSVVFSGPDACFFPLASSMGC